MAKFKSGKFLNLCQDENLGLDELKVLIALYTQNKSYFFFTEQKSYFLVKTSKNWKDLKEATDISELTAVFERLHRFGYLKQGFESILNFTWEGYYINF